VPSTSRPGKRKSPGPRKPRNTGRSRSSSRKKAKGGRLAAFIVAAGLVVLALAGAIWLIGGEKPEITAGSGTENPFVSTAEPSEASNPDLSAPESSQESPSGLSGSVKMPDNSPATTPEGAPLPAPSVQGPWARDTRTPTITDRSLPRGASPAERIVRAPGARTTGGVPERPKPRKGRIVLVIDDVGYNLEQLKPFLKFPGPIAFAVLPGLPHSKEAARMIKAAGKELLLHQPMEAVGGKDPGPGAIRKGMDELTIAAVIAENLASVPGAVGMNNHMGSAITEDPEAMRAVLEASRASGLYYLDSLTIPDSVVHSTALGLKMKTWERDVFLDNYPERAAILKQFDEGVKHAEKKGLSVMIGHVWSAQLAQTLVDLYPGLIEQGLSLSTISRIMIEDSDEDIGD
jgi:uncharacterized protein